VEKMARRKVAKQLKIVIIATIHSVTIHVRIKNFLGYVQMEKTIKLASFAIRNDGRD
jgi:hypothetical protein